MLLPFSSSYPTAGLVLSPGGSSPFPPDPDCWPESIPSGAGTHVGPGSLVEPARADLDYIGPLTHMPHSAALAKKS